jgi:cytochrome c biogenesis protein ResB
MVAVEALRTLITFERSIVWCLLLLRMGKEMRHVRRMTTVEPRHHARRHASYKRKLAVRIVDIGKNRCRREVA